MLRPEVHQATTKVKFKSLIKPMCSLILRIEQGGLGVKRDALFDEL